MKPKTKGAAGLRRPPRKTPSSSTRKYTRLHVARQEIALSKGRDDEKTTTKVRATKTTETAASTDDEEVDAVESLSKELKKKVDVIRKLEQRADCHEIELRFEIAEHCRDVKDGDSTKFGDHAMEKLADALGWASAIVYEYAKVARAWNSKEEALAVARAMNRGWRHLVAIASAPAEKRQDLIAAVRDERMTVRALQKHKKKMAPAASRAKSAPSTEDATPSIPLTEAIQDLAIDLTQFEEHGVPHAGRLAQAGAEAEPTDITPACDQQLRELRRRVEANYKTCIQAIDTCLAAGKQAKPEATKATPTTTKPAPTKSQAKPKPQESVAAGQNVEVASPA